MMPEMDGSQFFVVDLREPWRRHRYITLWRPNNSGYCWPLPWAGRYSLDQIKAGGSYYAERYHGKRTWKRFAVPCDAAAALTAEPRNGDVDGNVGPVLINDTRTRSALRRVRYVPHIPSPAQEPA